MFRSHLTKVSAVLLLTLALGAVATPAQAAGLTSERPGRWEQLAASFFGWLLKTSGMINPDGKAASTPSLETTSMIDPDGKAAAALSLDTTSMIDPNGSH